MNTNLVEILRAEMSQMNNRQIRVFKTELNNTMSDAVKVAARRAKKTSGKPQVKTNSENPRGKAGNL